MINSDFFTIINFTIINEKDGGIKSNMTCAGGKIVDYGKYLVELLADFFEC